MTDDAMTDDAPADRAVPDAIASVPFRATTVSFAQRSGRLKNRQTRTWEQLAPQFVIEPPRGLGRASVDPAFVLDPATIFGRDAPLVVEIGSGQGEAIARAARADPGTNFLGVEVYRPGVAQTLQRIRRDGLTNVRLIQADAVDVLSTALHAASVDELWVFFPDPWHKTKHTKRRLVTDSFAALAARVLAPGGVWRLATDWDAYADQMRVVTARAEAFVVDRAPGRFPGRPVTSFERKGLEKGRTITDIRCVRTP